MALPFIIPTMYIFFSGQGANTNVCSDTYCGPSAGSEPETQHYKNAILAVANRIAALLTVHTYGQMWMHPWSNTIDNSPFAPCERADDHDQMVCLIIH